ncbi:hypothetical protein F1C76_15920 [Geodermatophilaceae bacterium NBWT11]|nr:hypothetical protein F1C76_15920 [Geodermatophilaceae bacterium NBWT11]
MPAQATASPATGRQDWPALLGELTRQLDRGLVYDRHLAEISAVVRGLHAALERRRGASKRRW